MTMTIAICVLKKKERKIEARTANDNCCLYTSNGSCPPKHTASRGNGILDATSSLDRFNSSLFIISTSYV